MARKKRSQREIKWPAADLAMRGYLTIEKLPDRNRPKEAGGVWPAFRNDSDEDYLKNHPAYFEQEADGTPVKSKDALPTPEEIDMALPWLMPCQFMWQKSCDWRWWPAFRMYAHGASLAKIGDKLSMGSKQNVARIMDNIFRDIQFAAWELDKKKQHEEGL